MITKCFVVILTFWTANAKLQIYLSDGPIEKIGPRFYKKELLTDQYQSPKELAYDSSTRNLYFMYMDDYIQNSGRAYINIITKESSQIQGIEKNKATAVDSESGDVYFGTVDGLYKYNALENTAYNIGLYNMNILQLVIRNNDIYLIDANDHNLYKVYNDGKTAVKVSNTGNLIIFDVDSNKNIHYVSLCGLYCAEKGHEIIKNKDLSFVYNFIVEDDKVLGVTEHSIYELDCLNGTANKIADIDFFPRSIVHGDYGDMYYSADDSIYRLKPINSYVIYNFVTKKNNAEVVDRL